LLLHPGARVDREQPSDLDRKICRPLAERHEYEVLPDRNFRRGVEDQVVGVDFRCLQ
jgi:hypothetical protein